jgi:hypothetical protein
MTKRTNPQLLAAYMQPLRKASQQPLPEHYLVIALRPLAEGDEETDMVVNDSPMVFDHFKRFEVDQGIEAVMLYTLELEQQGTAYLVTHTKAVLNVLGAVTGYEGQDISVSNQGGLSS